MNFTESDKDRFWSKVNKTDDCWVWTGFKDKDGYGRFKYKGKNYRANRFAWMLTNNKEIPNKMFVCHHCDNPSCVNPTHLFLGTQSDNERDCWNKGRKSLSGENHTQNKLSLKQVYEILDSVSEAKHKWGGITKLCKTMGERYNVSMYTIRSVIYGDSWTHIKDRLNE
jgi:hypothetical protein